jgi:hypothetical protein
MPSCSPVKDDIAEPPMLGHHIYRVHREGDEWTVTKEGEDRSRARFRDRLRAIDEEMRLARADQPAKVRIDNEDGSIAEERLIGRDSSDALQR